MPVGCRFGGAGRRISPKMDLLEYQGKELFARHGLPVPAGKHAATAEQAVAVADEIGYPVAVKAQVLIGGRGKAGGIKIAADAGEAATHAEAIIGMEITGPHGEGPFTVGELWIEEGSEIESEYYASVILDRAEKKLLVMLSAKGGMDVEAIAESDPDALVREHVDPIVGFDAEQATILAGTAGVPEETQEQVASILVSLVELAKAEDATLIEVNPLAVLAGGKVVALDSKVTIDGNALSRHPELAEVAADPDRT